MDIHEPKALIDEVLETIQHFASFDPESAREGDTAIGRWNQGDWREFNPFIEAEHEDHRCQTSMCFAGWAVELNPQRQWLYSAKELAELHKVGRLIPKREYELVVANDSDPMVIGTITKHFPDGRTEQVDVTTARRAAMADLGLTDDAAEYLFEGSNTLTRIENIVFDIKAGTL